MQNLDSIIENFNDRDTQNSFDYKDMKDNMAVAVIPYFFSFLFFLPIVCNKNSTFCRFHANQQLTLLIAEVILYVVMGIIGIIPILGWLVDAVAGLAIFLFKCCLAYGAYKGKAIRIPFIGNFLNVF